MGVVPGLIRNAFFLGSKWTPGRARGDGVPGCFVVLPIKTMLSQAADLNILAAPWSRYSSDGRAAHS